MSSLAEQLEKIPFFPPGIQVFPKLLPLLNNDRSPTDELADVVRVDTGLTADILRVCNSATFGFKIRAQTVREAILRLGVRELYVITSKVVAAPILGNGGTDRFLDGVDLWRHSLATASAAAVLAKLKGVDSEVAFTAGLLHDIGKVRFVQTVGNDYAKLVQEARGGLQPLHTLEAAKWGIDHAVIAGQLLKNWGFPLTMRDAVLLHHAVMGASPNLEFAAIINIANYLAGSIGFPYDAHGPVFSPDPRALQYVGLNPEKLEELRSDVLHHFLREEAPFAERVT